ncbi:MAG: cation transporter [Candidatus Omnitrophica bacterium]|nr:cation transporter [Candidatus Omnitrophota bacterium]MBI3083252.1 cation transporter [Candidatus Omnitrophota bacterium]
MEHSHQRPKSEGPQGLLIALGLTLAMMVIEFIAGWVSGSLALFADAWHMLTDASMLALSSFAAWFSVRPATSQKTYGYYRMEVLAAFANGVSLWLVVIWIYARAIQRLHHPLMVSSGPMMTVAMVGLLVNLLSAWVLRKGRVSNLNIQGAWLNVMSDALGSVGVIVAGALIRRYGWMTADPIASMVIGILIAVTSWKLVTQAVNILLEGTPGHLRIHDIVQAMRTIPGIHEVHDIHLWTITTGMDAMSGHVSVEDMARSAEILSGLSALLSQRFGITHTTFQLEPRAHVCQLES